MEIQQAVSVVNGALSTWKGNIAEGEQVKLAFSTLVGYAQKGIDAENSAKQQKQQEKAASDPAPKPKLKATK